MSTFIVGDDLKTVVVSGGFDPLHQGHEEHIRLAAELGDRLVVIMNNDDFLMRKKGFVHTPLEERKRRLKKIDVIDEIVISVDTDQFVCKTLKMIKPNIFAKGGDRTIENMPKEEIDTCNAIGCEIVYDVGSKRNASSEIARKEREILEAQKDKMIYFEPAGQILTSHQYMFNNPPNGYKFIVNENNIGADAHRLLNEKLYKFGLGSVPWHIVKPYVEKFTVRPFRNAKFTFAWNHVIFRDEPWIIQVEWAEMLTGFSLFWHKRLKHIVERQLLSKNCKKIITWSDIARQSFKNYNYSKFEDKIEVVPLAIPSKRFARNYARDNVRFLSVCSATKGREDYNFHMKGGKEVLEAFNIISKDYNNVYLTIISEIPVNYLQKFSGHDKIRIINKRISYKEVVAQYVDADIFLFPGHDTPFGVILEAMSYGLPVVATDVYGNKELVEDKRTGFIIPASRYVEYFDGTIATRPMTGPKKCPSSIMKIDNNVINNLVGRMKILIEHDQLRKQMSINCFDEIENGIHSLKHRNAKLKNIFDEACGG